MIDAGKENNANDNDVSACRAPQPATASAALTEAAAPDGSNSDAPREHSPSDIEVHWSLPPESVPNAAVERSGRGATGADSRPVPVSVSQKSTLRFGSIDADQPLAPASPSLAPSGPIAETVSLSDRETLPTGQPPAAAAPAAPRIHGPRAAPGAEIVALAAPVGEPLPGAEAPTGDPAARAAPETLPAPPASRPKLGELAPVKPKEPAAATPPTPASRAAKSEREAAARSSAPRSVLSVIAGLASLALIAAAVLSSRPGIDARNGLNDPNPAGKAPKPGDTLQASSPGAPPTAPPEAPLETAPSVAPNEQAVAPAAPERSATAPRRAPSGNAFPKLDDLKHPYR